MRVLNDFPPTETLIYLFPTDSFERDEAHIWVHDSHYTERLNKLIAEERIQVFDIRQFSKAFNNRDLGNIWDTWFVCKNTIK